MYRRARSAMVRLGADSTLLKEYQALKKKDLQLNKDITEANRLFYQRNDSLPWLWMVGIEGQHEMTDCSKEGRLFDFYHKYLEMLKNL